MNPRMALFSASLPGWSAQEVIDTARLLGFAAIEWGTGPEQAIADPRSGAEIRALCGDAGLACSGVSVQDPRVTLANPKLAVPAVDLAVALGAPHVRVPAPRYRGESLRRQQKLTRDGLATLVDLASPHGLTVVVETSPGTLAPTPDSALALIEDHPPTDAGVLYDPGNMIIEGHVESRLAVARLQEYLVHVHVKNIVWSRRNRAWQWRHSRLTAGMADWPTILGALAAAGYVGRFSIDHLPGPPTESLLRDEAEALSGLIGCAFPVTATEASDQPPTGSRSPVVARDDE
jgi:sugar phosphate isomerase/epimerase